MHEIKKMLLATSDGVASHHGELRAALLSNQLKLDAFDMLTIKRPALRFGAGATQFSHVEVRATSCAAWRDGQRRALDLHADAEALAPIWQCAPGTASEVIVDLAQARQADLTLLAPVRRNRLVELLACSDSRLLLRSSRNNVLLVHSLPRDVYRRVLVAVDFSADCFAAARTALALAPDAHFTFVHAYRLPDHALMRELELPSALIGSFLARGCQTAWERLNKSIAALGPFPQPSVSAVHSGLPAAVIEASARRMDADLIVLGRQGGTRAAPDALGEVARRLGARAPCDVLIGAPLASPPSALHVGARKRPPLAQERCVTMRG